MPFCRDCDKLSQIEIDIGNHTHLLNMRSIAVTVLNGEIALRSILNLAQTTVRVLGKLLGSETCIAVSLLYHLWLDIVESLKKELHRVLPALTGTYGHTLLKQFGEVRLYLENRLNICGVDSYHRGDDVAATGIGVVSIGIVVRDLWCSDTELIVRQALLSQEIAYRLVLVINSSIEQGEIIAILLEGDRIDGTVCHNLALTEPAHADATVIALKVVHAEKEECAKDGGSENHRDTEPHKTVMAMVALFCVFLF